MKSFLVIFLTAYCVALGQLPALVSIPLAIESPALRDGEHQVTARWYNDALSGTNFGIERTVIIIQGGRSTITLGNASPLPVSLLESGNAWISIQFDGATEPTIRHHVTPVSFAQTAAFALVAASLDPRATGLVTSLNETAGAVELVGGSGIAISRRGQQLVISREQAREEGLIAGDGRAWQFAITLQDPALAGITLHCQVDSPHGLVLASSTYDPQTRSYLVTTSAVLQSDETLRWHTGHR